MRFGIIAAGKGSRLASEGIEAAKPMVRLGGVPLLGRLTEIFLRQRPVGIRIIVNGEDEATLDYANSLAKTYPDVVEIIVKATPDSMRSFAEVTRGWEGKFVVTTVDTVFREETFADYVRAFAQAPGDVDGLMGVTSFVDDEKPLWVQATPGGRITGFNDLPVPGESEAVSAGVYGLTDRALPVLERCIAEGVGRMRNFQRRLIEAGLRLHAYDLGTVVDIDHAADIAAAESLLRQAKR